MGERIPGTFIPAVVSHADFRDEWPLDHHGCSGADQDVAACGVAGIGVGDRHAEKSVETDTRVHHRLRDARCLLVRHLEAVSRVAHRVGEWADRQVIALVLLLRLVRTHRM
jgi:hypothetical protein